MSRQLLANFTLTSEQGPVYWWPLIFEVMQRHRFQFSAPGYSPSTGSYFYVRDTSPDGSNLPDMERVVGSFRALWDEIYRGTRDVIALFWSKDNSSFTLDMQVHQSEDRGRMSLSLIMSEAVVTIVSEEEAKEDLRVVLSCAKTLYEVCQPSSGQLSWENGGFLPWASFGQGLEVPQLPPSLREKGACQVVRQRLSDGSPFSLLDPVPLPRDRGTWEWVSLLEEE